MLLIGITYPISAPLIAFAEGNCEEKHSVFTSPWRVCEIIIQEEKDKEEAYKKTYKYQYSQSEEAIKNL